MERRGYCVGICPCVCENRSLSLMYTPALWFLNFTPPRGATWVLRLDLYACLLKKKKNSASHIHPSLRFFHFILPRGVTLGWTYAGTGGDNRGCRERRRAWGERSCWANAQVGRSWVGKPRRCRGKERGLEPSDEESAGPTCWRLPFLPLTAASTCFDGSGTRS